MARAIIGIGTNLGDRAAQLDLARRGLLELPLTQLLAFSGAYETAPVGLLDQPAFLNAAALIQTQLEPDELLRRLLEIERRAGRPARAERIRWGPRPLDLDILLYDERVIDSDALRIPHPRMHERWFALKPAAEVAPQAVHPLLGKTLAELLRAIEGSAPGGVDSPDKRQP